MTCFEMPPDESISKHIPVNHVPTATYYQSNQHTRYKTKVENFFKVPMPKYKNNTYHDREKPKDTFRQDGTPRHHSIEQIEPSIF
jgi:hypothetical protein